MHIIFVYIVNERCSGHLRLDIDIPLTRAILYRQVPTLRKLQL